MHERDNANDAGTPRGEPPRVIMPYGRPVRRTPYYRRVPQWCVELALSLAIPLVVFSVLAVVICIKCRVSSYIVDVPSMMQLLADRDVVHRFGDRRYQIMVAGSIYGLWRSATLDPIIEHIAKYSEDENSIFLITDQDEFVVFNKSTEEVIRYKSSDVPSEYRKCYDTLQMQGTDLREW